MFFRRREIEISRMEVNKCLRKSIRGEGSDLSHWHHLRAHCLRLMLPGGGEERGTHVSIVSLLALTLTRNKSSEGPHARGQCLTLTWMSPLMVTTSEEFTPLRSLHAAGYSSKRDTVHTLTQSLCSLFFASTIIIVCIYSYYYRQAIAKRTH